MGCSSVPALRAGGLSTLYGSNPHIVCWLVRTKKPLASGFTNPVGTSASLLVARDWLEKSRRGAISSNVSGGRLKAHHPSTISQIDNDLKTGKGISGERIFVSPATTFRSSSEMSRVFVSIKIANTSNGWVFNVSGIFSILGCGGPLAMTDRAGAGRMANLKISFHAISASTAN